MKKMMVIVFVLLFSSQIFAKVVKTKNGYKLDSFSQEEINYVKDIKSTRDPWTIQDTILELSFLTLAAIDLWQTYTFLYKDKDPESLELLGERPSKKELFLKAGLWGLGHVGIALLIPNKYLRNAWQVAGITIHFCAIGKNYSLGVRLSI